jgi:hypothetical protein
MTLAAFVLCLSNPGYGLGGPGRKQADQSDGSREWENKQTTTV